MNIELEQLKAEVEKKLADVRSAINEYESEIVAKIDKIHENQLEKTLRAIQDRLAAIEEKLGDKDEEE